MAIKNILLGGASEFVPGVNTSFSTDLNDTFNAAADLGLDAAALNPWRPLISSPGVNQGFIAFSSTTWCIGQNGGTSGRRTTNGGASWSSITMAHTLAAGAFAKVFGSSTHAISYEGTGKLVGYTSDAGATWTSGTAPASFSTIRMVSAPTTTRAVMCGTVSSLRSIAFSTNNGSTWTVATTGPTGASYAIAMFDANTGFCVDGSSNIWKTTDGGVNWTDTTYNVQNSPSSTAQENIMIALSDNSFVYSSLSSRGEIELFTGSANAQKVAHHTLSGTSSDSIVGFVKTTAGYIYMALVSYVAGVQGIAVLLRSKDSGITWQTQLISFPASAGSSTSQMDETGTNRITLCPTNTGESLIQLNESRE